MAEHQRTQPRRSVSHQVSSSSSPKANNENDNNSYYNNGSSNAMSLRRRGSVNSTGTASTLHSPRRNSTLSDAISETRNSIRSSTGDLLFPKASGKDDDNNVSDSSTAADYAGNESHWNSAPLVLALLPAIAGIFFRNGSAFITDVTLLVLAAVFLNWSVRLPWDWYHSARTGRQQENATTAAISPEATDGNQTRSITAESSSSPREPVEQNEDFQRKTITANAATVELHFHELAALTSCFVFPLVGTWLLHVIRSSLSRPSEGLVSNYNLTIFLLASELRPCAHLLRMVRSRTLFLQRAVASSSSTHENNKIKVQDLDKRLEEVEARVAETAAMRLALSDLSNRDSNHDQPQSPSSPPSPSPQKNHPEINSQLAEIREAFQSELEALYRGVRRYEKRATLTNRQTDARLQQLETQVRDAATLSATQRPVALGRGNFAFGLLSWSYAVVMVPIQTFMFLARLPVRITMGLFGSLISIFTSGQTELPGSTKQPQDLPRQNPKPSQTRKTRKGIPKEI